MLQNAAKANAICKQGFFISRIQRIEAFRQSIDASQSCSVRFAAEQPRIPHDVDFSIFSEGSLAILRDSENPQSQESSWKNSFFNRSYFNRNG